MSKSRITIKPYILDYVAENALQLGIDDFSEVVSILLLDHKRGLCSCSHSRSTDTQPKDTNELLADGLEDFLNSSSY